MFIIEQCDGDASSYYLDAFEAAWREDMMGLPIVVFANFWIGH